jgi:hypothetical protein
LARILGPNAKVERAIRQCGADDIRANFQNKFSPRAMRWIKSGQPVPKKRANAQALQKEAG